MKYYHKNHVNRSSVTGSKPISGYILYFVIIALVWLVTLSSNAQSSTIASGSFIINMGVTPQTVANGLKPYGLVYDLIYNYNVPVLWSINTSKARDGTDFTYNSVDYKGGPFIIPKEFINSAVTSRITYWTGLGVQGVYSTSSFSAPIYDTLTSFPKLMLDTLSGNEAIIGTYYTNAGIPSSSYKKGVPSDLTACYDIWSNPHADPNWASHGFLYNFVTNYKGHIWSECHTVSMMEGCKNSAAPYEQLNFLTSSGLKCYSNNKCGSINENHGGNPSSPYTYNYAGDPIMQFMGTMDGATQNGSERWFIPPSTGQWNNTTKRLVTTSDGSSPREGALMAYGPAYGLTSNGYVMYEGGHDLDNGSTTEKVAAQRAYFNFLLFTGGKKKLSVNANFPLAANSGDTHTITATISNGTAPYTYQWTSLRGGIFDSPNASSTAYHPPVSFSDTTDIVELKVTDACGRVNFKVAYIPVNHLITLPITLSYFQAEPVDNKFVLTSWMTSSEQNNDHFTIERSPDAIHFETAGEKNGAGNSSTIIQYSFLDEHPYEGVSYYRLKQIDHNKNITISPLVQVKIRLVKTKIFPNPVSARESLTVLLPDLQNQEANIQLFDLSGKLVIKKTVRINNNRQEFQLSMTGLPAGLYTLAVSSENFFEQQNLTIY